MGNPRLGFRSQLKSNFSLDFSIVLPNVSRDDDLFPAVNGFYTRYDEIEMFMPEITSISIDGLVNFSKINVIQPFIKLGMIGWKIEQESNDSEYDLISKYSIGFNVNQSNFLFTAKLKGLAIITEPDLDFGERNLNSFVFAFKLKSKLAPGFYILAPLDDQRDIVKYTIGMGISARY